MISTLIRILRNPRRKKRKGASAKSKRKGIESRKRQIRAHEEKIRQAPNSPAVGHWKHEIAELKKQLGEP